MSFIVCALPRSRTRWLAELLTFGEWKCHHEIALGMREVADISRFFARPFTGTAETAVAPGWELLRHQVPDIRAVVVRRPVDEVVASMMWAGLGVVTYDERLLRRNMEYGARALDRMALTPGVLSIDFRDLDRIDTCAELFAHCLGLPMPGAHWAALAGRDIQVNVASVFAYYERHRSAVERFKRACKSELRSLARSGIIQRAA